MPAVKETIFQIDQRATADKMRRLRMKNGISLRAISKELGLSSSYVSDLERGHRNWSEVMVERFEAAVATSKNKRTAP